MKRQFVLFISLFLILIFLTTRPEGGGKESVAYMTADIATDIFADTSAKTVLIGFTASQTDHYNVESTRQINGLNLWMWQINNQASTDMSTALTGQCYYAWGGDCMANGCPAGTKPWSKFCYLNGQWWEVSWTCRSHSSCPLRALP